MNIKSAMHFLDRSVAVLAVTLALGACKHSQPITDEPTGTPRLYKRFGVRKVTFWYKYPDGRRETIASAPRGDRAEIAADLIAIAIFARQTEGTAAVAMAPVVIAIQIAIETRAIAGIGIALVIAADVA